MTSTRRLTSFSLSLVPHSTFTQPSPPKRGRTRIPAPASPAPLTETPAFLPTPRFISPRPEQTPIGVKSKYAPTQKEATFDTIGDRAAGWVPASGKVAALERWKEMVPATSTAALGGSYAAVRWDSQEDKGLGQLSDARFAEVLDAAKLPSTRRKFAAWIRDGMPDLNGRWEPPTDSELSLIPEKELLGGREVPPNAARIFAQSLLPKPSVGVNGAQIHPPNFLFHLSPTSSTATETTGSEPALKSLAREKPQNPSVLARVLGTTANETQVLGVGGFVGSAPRSNTVVLADDRTRLGMVEVELTRAFWRTTEEVVLEGNVKAGRPRMAKGKVETKEDKNRRLRSWLEGVEGRGRSS